MTVAPYLDMKALSLFCENAGLLIACCRAITACTMYAQGRQSSRHASEIMKRYQYVRIKTFSCGFTNKGL
jgi:hypothetical protein